MEKLFEPNPPNPGEPVPQSKFTAASTREDAVPLKLFVVKYSPVRPAPAAWVNPAKPSRKIAARNLENKFINK